MGEDEDIVVLGATSLVGRWLLRRLETAPGRIKALSRTEHADEPGVVWVKGDLEQAQTLRSLTTAARVFSLQPIWMLPQALSTLRDLGLKRLVAFSSTSLFTKQGSTSAYERNVAQKLATGEAEVQAFCRSNAIGFTLLRPTLIYAEGQDANVSRLAHIIRRFGVIPLAGEGKGLRQPVHADDLAQLAIDAMKRPAANRAYNTPGGETLTYRAMVERIFEGLDLRPRVLPLPMGLVKLGYGLARPLLPGSTSEMIGRMNEDLVFDPSEAQRDFDWAPRAFHPRF